MNADPEVVDMIVKFLAVNAVALSLLAVLAKQFGLHFPAGTRFGPPGSPWRH